jgi:Peptidase family M48
MLLPILYFGLIVAIGYGVYWHIGNHEWFTDHLTGVWGLLAYAAPILTGGILIFFMSRPFFARAKPSPDLITVTPEAEPVLFEFIHAICGLVRAPFPKRVYVDWQVNASASLHRGFRSLFNRDLDLTIGLSLVSGLTVSQLGGVLGHEFGHFAQGAGMRLSFVIRTMINWLARVAYQPQDLEQKLASSGLARNLSGGLVLAIAQAGIWVTRRILHGFLLLGHAISCFSLRQMEFDADRYEAKVAGAREFGEVTRRIRFLNAGWAGAYQLLVRTWEDRRLASDLPALALARTEAVLDYSKRAIEQEAKKQRTGWFHTHPSDSERMARVNIDPPPAAFEDCRPAAHLFSDFTALSEEVTLHYYRLLELPLDDTKLVGVEEICAGMALGPAKLAAVRAYFSNRLSAAWPIAFAASELGAVLDGETAQTRICENLEGWTRALAESETAFEKFQDAQSQIIASRQARILMEARIRFKPEDFLLTRRSSKEAMLLQERAMASLTESGPSLARFEMAVRRRLTDALRLPTVASPVQGVSLAKLASAISNFGLIGKLLSALEIDFLAYAALYGEKKARSPRRKAHKLQLERSQALNEQVKMLDPLLRDLILPYPERESLLARIRRRLPEMPLSFETTVFRNASTYIEEINRAYFEVVGDLCLAAQAAEATLLENETSTVPAAFSKK